MEILPFIKEHTGLKALGEARDLKEGFGDKPSREVAEQIRTLTRRGFLKLGVLGAVLGTTIATPLIKSHLEKEDLAAKRKEIETAISKYLWESLGNKLNEGFPIDQQIEENGKLVPFNEKTVSELGIMFGFPYTSKNVSISDEPNPIIFIIDRRIAVVQPYQGNAMIGHAFTLIKNTQVQSKYIFINKITNFRIRVPYSYKLYDQIYKATYLLDYQVATPSQKEEDEIKNDVRKQLDLADPKQVPSLKSFQDTRRMVDKKDMVFIPPSEPTENFVMEMGKEIVFIGDPKVMEGMTGKHFFKVVEAMRLTILDKDGKIIDNSILSGSMLFSKEHLKHRGAKKIVLNVTVIVKLESGDISRELRYEYGPEDFAKFENQITVKYSNGVKGTFKP